MYIGYGMVWYGMVSVHCYQFKQNSSETSVCDDTFQ